MADTDKLVEQLSNLSVLEIAGLVKQLEEKWGVSAAAPVAVAAGPVAGGATAGAAAPAAEEKTAFGVVLTEMGANKIAVIKEVRSAVPGLGLAEAKALVEGAPKTIKEGVTKQEADEIKKKVEAAGAKVDIK
jgi:large subunit ribosomal protein L7/L12